MKKNKKNRLLDEPICLWGTIIFLIFTISGELTEITTQTVRFEDHITQYAIVNVINGTANYLIYCNDCTGNLTIKQGDTIILKDKQMSELEKGYFGYKAKASELKKDIKYTAIINFTSPTYGSGQAISEFTIYDYTGEDEDINNWWSQIYQAIDDLLGYMSKEDQTCQIIADTNNTFYSPKINRHVYITEYTHDMYLPSGFYYWRVRCKIGDTYSGWSETRNFTHREPKSIYFDWTIEGR